MDEKEQVDPPQQRAGRAGLELPHLHGDAVEIERDQLRQPRFETGAEGRQFRRLTEDLDLELVGRDLAGKVGKPLRDQLQSRFVLLADLLQLSLAFLGRGVMDQKTERNERAAKQDNHPRLAADQAVGHFLHENLSGRRHRESPSSVRQGSRYTGSRAAPGATCRPLRAESSASPHVGMVGWEDPSTWRHSS